MTVQEYFANFWAHSLFSASDVHDHEKYGYQQSHSSRYHVNWYQESNEGCYSQQASWEVGVH